MQPKQDLIKSMAQQNAVQYDSNKRVDLTFVYSFNLDKMEEERRKAFGTRYIYSIERKKQHRIKHGY